MSENAALDVASLKVADLKTELSARGLSTKGLKKELSERLQEAVDSPSAEISEVANGEQNEVNASAEQPEQPQESVEDKQADVEITQAEPEAVDQDLKLAAPKDEPLAPTSPAPNVSASADKPVDSEAAIEKPAAIEEIAPQTGTAQTKAEEPIVEDTNAADGPVTDAPTDESTEDKKRKRDQASAEPEPKQDAPSGDVDIETSKADNSESASNSTVTLKGADVDMSAKPSEEPEAKRTRLSEDAKPDQNEAQNEKSKEEQRGRSLSRSRSRSGSPPRHMRSARNASPHRRRDSRSRSRSRSPPRRRRHSLSRSRSRSPPRRRAYSPDGPRRRRSYSRSRSPPRRRRSPVSRSRSRSPPRTIQDSTSPPPSASIYIKNLVRPLQVAELKSLLAEYGEVDYFWIDSIKSQVYATFDSVDSAQAATKALQGTQWPPNTGRNLSLTYVPTSAISTLVQKEDQAKILRTGRLELSATYNANRGEWEFDVKPYVPPTEGVRGMASSVPFSIRGAASASVTAVNAPSSQRMSMPVSGPFAGRGMSIRGRGRDGGFGDRARDSGYGARDSGYQRREEPRREEGVKMTRTRPSIEWKEAQNRTR